MVSCGQLYGSPKTDAVSEYYAKRGIASARINLTPACHPFLSTHGCKFYSRAATRCVVRSASRARCDHRTTCSRPTETQIAPRCMICLKSTRIPAYIRTTVTIAELLAERTQTATDEHMGTVVASQFPSRCERLLLFEDDLAGQGLGATAHFMAIAVLRFNCHAAKRAGRSRMSKSM